jgi:hypothetical protein
MFEASINTCIGRAAITTISTVPDIAHNRNRRSDVESIFVLPNPWSRDRESKCSDVAESSIDT